MKLTPTLKAYKEPKVDRKCGVSEEKRKEAHLHLKVQIRDETGAKHGATDDVNGEDEAAAAAVKPSERAHELHSATRTQIGHRNRLVISGSRWELRMKLRGREETASTGD
ncbi:hypothetical protein Y032_0034g2817 [Ancylostoma ceylanicum]|uniref:Uncharacterized protein n=1 Tax=Ancylostoma ceylanicum TaxID=53326 RepID=A0A016UNR5_9BILA|nr:hypothetical protein Y032_0034g2817 [Ancylostoma ceylanicum]